MELFLVLTVNFVDLVLSVLMIAMFIRAILSFLMMGEDSKLGMLMYIITEPFIMPIRILLEKINLFQGTPLDVSFFLTTLIIAIVQTVLSAIPM